MQKKQLTTQKSTRSSCKVPALQALCWENTPFQPSLGIHLFFMFLQALLYKPTMVEGIVTEGRTSWRQRDGCKRKWKGSLQSSREESKPHKKQPQEPKTLCNFVTFSVEQTDLLILMTDPWGFLSNASQYDNYSSHYYSGPQKKGGEGWSNYICGNSPPTPRGAWNPRQVLYNWAIYPHPASLFKESCCNSFQNDIPWKWSTFFFF